VEEARLEASREEAQEAPAPRLEAVQPPQAHRDRVEAWAVLPGHLTAPCQGRVPVAKAWEAPRQEVR
jgi:hypothetical protein